MNRRKQQSIADWAAIGLCPSLIVLLISSLVYFMVICVYRGGYSGRIGYIWFCFIVGAVGIARLSIQESRKYAMGYAAVLGLATWFVLSRFMTVQGPVAAFSPIINAAIIAIVWFLADRITFDCTLIDEDDDASGRGLLDGLTDEGASDQDSQQHASRKRGHQPGRTVLWLTAAALPIFGIGQMMLPPDQRLQQSAVLALAVYLFATLSLLVATSFLGVRRYLRQRGVDMPGNVSAAWLVGGVVMTAVMLLVCFLLPQPGKLLADAKLPQSVEPPEWLKPSKYGWGSETAKPDAGATDAATASSQSPREEPDAKPGDGDSSQSSGQPGGQKPGSSGPPSDKGKQGAASDKGEEGKGAGEKGEKGEAGKEGNSDAESRSQAGEQSGSKSQSKPSDDQLDAESQSPSDQSESRPSEPQQSDDSSTPPANDSSSSPSDLLPSIGGVIRFLIYAVLIGILAAFAWFQRYEIAKWWQAFLAWLRGEAESEISATETATSTETSRPQMPFSAFRNPLDDRGDPREAVIVTYQAAEAWWRERGQPRQPDETPFEFSRRLKTSNKADHDALLRLTEAYNRIVYGNDVVQQPDLAAAAAVWRSFASS